MKHSISFLTVSIMLMVMMSGSASAQTESDKSLRNAVNILKYSDSEDEQRAAFDLIHTASERNNPYAMNTLGMVYMRGIGVAKDSVKSVYWLTKAGDAGFSIAWDNLGRMYKNKASGVRQDFVNFHITTHPQIASLSWLSNLRSAFFVLSIFLVSNSFSLHPTFVGS